MVKCYMLFLDVLFLSCSVYYLLAASASPRSLLSQTVAYTFMLSGLLLLVSSLLLRKKHPGHCLAAWIILFATFMIAALSPRF